MTDAKEMWEAIKSRFGGNDESKKMQKYILKQQFEGFSESHEANQKFFRSLPSAVSNFLIMRTKPGVDSLSLDDIIFNLRVFEPDVKGSTASSSSMQNVAFVYENTSSTNEVNLRGIKIVGGEMLDTLGTKLKTIEGDQENKRNLKLCNSSSDTEVTSCSKECKESYAKLKKLYDEQREQLGDASIEIQAYTQALKKVEAQLVAHQQNQLWYEEKIRFMKINLDDKTDVLTYHKKLLAEAKKEKEELKAKVEKWHNSSKNLNILLTSQMSARDKAGLGYGNQMNKGVLSYENEVFESVFYSRSSDIEDSPVNDRYAEGMHAVPPPMTGIYIPSGPDKEIDDSQFTYGPKQSKPSESDARSSDFNSCESNSSEETLKSMPEPVVNEPKVVSQPKVWSDAPIIEEYESDSDDEHVSLPTKEQETPSFAFVNTPVRSENQAYKNAGPKDANHSAGTKDNIDAENSEMEAESAQDYFPVDLGGDPAFLKEIESASKVNERKLMMQLGAIRKVVCPKITEDLLLNLPMRRRQLGKNGFTEIRRMKEVLWLEIRQGWLPRGHRQEEGIDYDEVFAPVARIEAIRIFLAFASYMGFIVYQMDVKSAFLYGTIDEEVYVSQPPGFVDPKCPKKVYKVVKALYGLHQAPRAWYATLIYFLLKSGYRRGSWCDEFEALMKSRFQMSSMGELTFFLRLQCKTASTPIETRKPLVKDEEAVDVDVTPKTSHLNAMKRIFRYLKSKPKLGLWYPRVSLFDLEAYSDSDYAGANLDRKSTTGGCQFLGRRLILWQCKKQTIVATSTTEAEYVAAANCCRQVLWIQNQMLDYGFNFMNTKIYIDNESTIFIIKNPVFNSKTKHIEIRHHFIRDAYEKKLIQVLKIQTDDNVADLLTKAFDVSRFNFLIVNIGIVTPRQGGNARRKQEWISSQHMVSI
ncbi:putative ribonuclease H-like domain-containing protein [Tanacetum coccineum]